jgi:hypothetical protein
VSASVIYGTAIGGFIFGFVRLVAKPFMRRSETTPSNTQKKTELKTGFDETLDQTAAAAALRPMPVVVLTASDKFIDVVPKLIQAGELPPDTPPNFGGAFVRSKIDVVPKLIQAGELPPDTPPNFGGAFVRSNAPGVVRIGLETGPTATWLWTELKRLGLPVICIDARHAAKRQPPSPRRRAASRRKFRAKVFD